MGQLEKLLAAIERSRVKRRLKQAYARKPKPAKVRIPDEDAPAAHQPAKSADGGEVDRG